MLRIALKSLAHDRGKLVAALAGVTFAAVLVLTQLGMYQGFLETSSVVIRRLGGDLWIMAKGVQVFEFAEPLSPGVAGPALSQSCVARVRGVIASYSLARRADGGLEEIVLVGFEPAQQAVFPWAMSRGVPADLHAVARVSVDDLDLDRLGLPRDPVGAPLEVGDRTAYIGATTHHLRSFTLAAYIFADVDTARWLLRMEEGQAHYWIVDLTDKRCAPLVKVALLRNPDIDVLDTEAFARRSETHWVDGAGAGAALALGAILGLVVGIVVVGQTLYAITKDHRRELATLKALGATNGEVVRFVIWQASVLAALGSTLGYVIARGLSQLASNVGLTISLVPWVVSVALTAVVIMCLMASIASTRAVLRLEPAEVFR